MATQGHSFVSIFRLIVSVWATIKILVILTNNYVLGIINLFSSVSKEKLNMSITISYLIIASSKFNICIH